MKKADIVQILLGKRLNNSPINRIVKAFAPTNIALCKYWGKRNQELNLPITSSLSISLGNKGATTTLKVIDGAEDSIVLNGQTVDRFSKFSKRLLEYLNIFRHDRSIFFHIDIESNIPIAAGLASSACGFAALVMALNKLFDWQLNSRELSLLARLGSGSASRSIWSGFVEWHAGMQENGMDSYGEMIPVVWSELCIGLMILSKKEKNISSRDAMQRTVDTSPLYPLWPGKVKHDLAGIKEAIHSKNFLLLGKTAESNALTMHATMFSAWPPVCYYLPETMAVMQKVWELRQGGMAVYFTQDAGPNLKLLFLKKESDTVKKYFPELEIIMPF